MRKMVLPLIVVAVAFAAAARADDDVAKKVIEKAIAAHGGAEALAKSKNKATIMKGKMSINIMGGLEGTMEMFAGDKKFKQAIQLSIMGMDINQVVCYDGKEMWIAVNGKVIQTITGKDLDAIKDSIHAEEMAGLALLGDKDLTFSVIGDSKVGENEAIGIKVSKKDRKDVSLYFDKKSGLLLKMENRNLDFQTKEEVNDEKLMHDYKKIDGVMHPSRIVMNRNDKKFLEMDITERKIVDKLDDGTFDKP
jgi:hypothetical protein